jgi:hypothetical protein
MSDERQDTPPANPDMPPAPIEEEPFNPPHPVEAVEPPPKPAPVSSGRVIETNGDGVTISHGAVEEHFVIPNHGASPGQIVDVYEDGTIVVRGQVPPEPENKTIPSEPEPLNGPQQDHA